MPIRQFANLAELKAFIAPIASRRIDEVVAHHTAGPTAKQYKGLPSWTGIDYYHEYTRRWHRRGPVGDELAIGYHIGIGPDGSIWKLRDYRWAGCGVLNRNAHTLHFAMVGNFDVEDPMTNGLPVAAAVTAVLMQRFALTLANVRFHREFQNKTCPGTRVGLTQFRNLVATAMGADPIEPVPDVIPAIPWLRIVIGSDAIDEAQPKMHQGHMYCLAAPTAAHLGKTVPAGVDVHDSGYALGTELFAALGYVLQYAVTPQGHRWYPKLPEWITQDQ